MCKVDQKMSCQVTFTPIKSQSYLSEIDRVLTLIEKSGLAFEVATLSTTILGDKDKVWQLLKTIFDEMASSCYFTMDVKVSNICGCQS